MLLRGLIKMSKKDFDRYYKEVKDQYYEMIGTLEELSELASTGMVSPEMVDNTKNLIEPIKQNYMTLSYVSFLLNTPKRTRKIDTFVKQNKKLLAESGDRTKDNILKENSEAIEKLEKAILNQKENH